MMEIAKLIESEIGDFFAGFGHPGEPETPEEMQSQLLARVMPLLAGLEQEPVAQVYQPANIGICAPLGPSVMMLKPLSLGTKLYAAPQLPQPSVPDKAVFGEMPFLGSGERDYVRGWNDCRAAMLKHSAPFMVTSDHRMMEMPQVEDINAVAAMLQGAESVSQTYTLRDGIAAIRSLGPIDAGKIQAERDALNEPTCWCHTCRPVTMNDARFVVCPDCGNKRCPHANDHRNTCTGSNEPGQEGSAYPAAPQQE